MNGASPITLGSFELVEPVGRGGMAVVWKGRHRTQRTPVAAKVMTSGQALNAQFRASFRNEVRALAGLDHPNIVMVCDYGEVPVEAEEASGGSLTAGSPYLIMEYASQGTLNQVLQPLKWKDLRRLLISMLDALAFAHSRGIIHLDLKPANVLLAGRRDLRPGLKLTDFGLAYVMSGPARSGLLKSTASALDLGQWSGVIPGTPMYMAPEQFEGAFRDYGPWTDLYALGCMAYRMAAGRPPFSQDGFIQLMYAHFKKEPPPLNPLRAVPEGFEEWLRTLLEKDPGRRFERAADAACALMALDEPSVSAPPRPSNTRTSAADAAADDPEEALTEVISVTEWINEVRTSLAAVKPSRGEEGAPPGHPVLPEHWSSSAPSETGGRLLEAGLGLFGLRTIPMVARKRERDVLWNALRKVHDERRAHAVILRGPAGTGKSRLVEWLTWRAHEVGGATILKASHSPMDSPFDGLIRMLVRYLNCSGLRPKEITERVAAVLRSHGVRDAYEWEALAALIGSGSAQADGRLDEPVSSPHIPIRFGEPGERYAVVARLLERISGKRPIIVWLEDVHWGSDAMTFCSYVLKAQAVSASPILFLLTVQDEALAERLLETNLLGELEDLPGVTRLEVGPLSMRDHLELVHQIVPLERELAKRVAARTRGNPLFAVQLIGDWVQRGVLRATDRGYEREDPGVDDLPDTLHEVWKARINRLLKGSPPDALMALEIAALLGQEVNLREWKTACEVDEILPPDDLLDRLLASRLARLSQAQQMPETSSTWAFVHGMLRESLERSAREAGRLAAHHRTCVTMLKKLYRADRPGILERLGRHYLGAEWYEAALDPLLKAAGGYLDTGDFRLSQTLLDLRVNALRAINLPRSDRKWGEGDEQRIRVLLALGQVDAAYRLAVETERNAIRFSWRELDARCLLLKAEAEEKRSDLASAEESYEEAIARFRQLGLPKGVADCLLGQALCAKERGEIPRSSILLRQAQSTYRRCGDETGQTLCILRLGHNAHVSGRLKRAAELYEEALALFERSGHQPYRAETLRALGIVTIELGQPARGIELLRRAIAIFQRCGSQMEVANGHNDLAETERRRGNFEGAIAGYRRSIAMWEAIGGGAKSLFPKANLGAVLVLTGRYDEARATLESCRRALEADGRLILLSTVHASLIPCTAASGDWNDFDAYLDKIRASAPRDAIEPDDLKAIELGARLALRAGESDRARRAFELARRFWVELDREDCAGRVEEALRALA